MSVDSRKIQQRVEARREAAQIIELAADYTASKSADCSQVFWEAIREHALQAAPLPKGEPAPRQQTPMADAEARIFEQRIMSFGQHKGARISEVPLRYLDWLAGQDDHFRVDVARYLLNEAIAKELEKDLQDG